MARSDVLRPPSAWPTASCEHVDTLAHQRPRASATAPLKAADRDGIASGAVRADKKDRLIADAKMRFGEIRCETRAVGRLPRKQPDRQDGTLALAVGCFRLAASSTQDDQGACLKR
jgi:hypothetical protein